MTNHAMSERSSQSTLDLDLLTWFELNKKLVVTGLSLVVVAIGVGIVWKYQSRQSAIRASNSLILAKLQVGEDESLSLDTLNELASKFGSHPSSDQARLLAARTLFTDGKFAEARARFEQVADSKVSDFAAIGMLGVAASFEAEKNTDAALQAYQRVLDFPGAGGLSFQAGIAKARLHESLGKPEDALLIYDKLSGDDFTVASSEIRMRRADLLRRFPELDRSNVMTNTVEVRPGEGLAIPQTAPTLPEAAPSPLNLTAPADAAIEPPALLLADPEEEVADEEPESAESDASTETDEEVGEENTEPEAEPEAEADDEAPEDESSEEPQP